MPHFILNSDQGYSVIKLAQRRKFSRTKKGIQEGGIIANQHEVMGYYGSKSYKLKL